MVAERWLAYAAHVQTLGFHCLERHGARQSPLVATTSGALLRVLRRAPAGRFVVCIGEAGLRRRAWSSHAILTGAAREFSICMALIKLERQVSGARSVVAASCRTEGAQVEGLRPLRTETLTPPALSVASRVACGSRSQRADRLLSV